MCWETQSLFHGGMGFRNTIRANKARTSFCRMTQLNIYQSIMYTYIYIYSNELCNIKMYGLFCSYFEFLKPNVKYNDVKYVILYFKKWHVIFVYLMDNQQAPLYCTLYRGYHYGLQNQFTIKGNVWYIAKSNTTKQFRFNTGCWTK